MGIFREDITIEELKVMLAREREAIKEYTKKWGYNSGKVKGLRNFRDKIKTEIKLKQSNGGLENDKQ